MSVQDEVYPLADPQRLRLRIQSLSGELDRGECTATVAELDIIAAICERAGLPDEAARVRRWIGISHAAQAGEK